MAAPAPTPADHATTARISVRSDGQIPTGSSYAPAISGDGRIVAFTSEAPDLVAGDANTCRGYPLPGTCKDIFAKDLATGEVELISKSSAGRQGDNWSGEYPPALSADGRFVAFVSTASNLVPGDTNACDWYFDNVLENCADVFVRDRTLGTTVRVSIASNGAQIDGCRVACATWPSISSDGRFVAFSSGVAGLDPNHPAGTGLYVRDRDADDDGVYDEPGATSTEHIGSGGASSLSADGRYVAFSSGKNAVLVPEDANGVPDVYVYDRLLGVMELASVRTDGSQSPREAWAPDISADGRWVVMEGSMLVSGQKPQAHVYARDRLKRETHLVSRGWDGVSDGNDSSWDSYPKISDDGRYVAYDSRAWNLVPWDQIGDVTDVYVFDLHTMKNVKASVNADGEWGNSFSGSVGIDATGRRIVFASWSSNLDPQPAPFESHVFLRDRGEVTCAEGHREEGRISSKAHHAEAPAGPAGFAVHEGSCVAAARSL